MKCAFAHTTVAFLAGFSLFVGARSAWADNDASEWGTLKGRIVFGGEQIPQPVQINVDKDQAACLANGPLFSEELVVNAKNRGVRWVFVWLIPDPGNGPLKIHPSLVQVKDKQVTIDQPCCQFIPHALALRQGQDLVAKNSAGIAHNIHWTGHPLKNPGGNVIVPAKQQYVIQGLLADKWPVVITCDIHGWMKGYVRVFDHPYFALSDANGTFEIKNAPAGKFRMMVWHDTGFGPGLREGTPVVIKGNAVTNLGELKLR